MTKRVVAVDENETIKDLFTLMDKHGILGVPVVDKDRHVVGIVTEGDLLKHFTTLSTPTAINLLGGLIYLEDIKDFNQHLREHCAETVRDLMTQPVVVLKETDTLQDAINTMSDKQVNRLPVVDAHHKLSGILTRKDVVHQLSKIKKP